MRKRRKHNNKNSNHHIIPKSRGGNTNPSNIKKVSVTKHEAYHILFKNALPEEAVQILVKEWFYTERKPRKNALVNLVNWLLKGGC